MINPNPLVSIIIPAYNVEQYLDACVTPILNQTYINLEIIIVDDGSPDNCGMMCDAYASRDSRVKVIHKPNGGLSSARNAGLDICKGEFISCIDSDDVVSEDYIEHMVAMAQKFEADAVCCSVEIFLDGNTPVFDRESKNIQMELSQIQVLKRFLYLKDISVGALGNMFRSDLFHCLRYPEGKLYEDIYTHAVLFSRAVKIAYSSSVKCNYRIRKTSQIRQPFTLKEMDCIEQSEKLYDFVTHEFPELKSAATCALFGANLTTFYKIPNKQYQPQLNQIWRSIKKHRMTVLFDKDARRKTRAAILLSFLGKRLAHRVGKVILRQYNLRQMGFAND